METENRLIDANVVLAKKFTTGLSDASGNYYGNADVVFADDIENAPTVDAVKVVRCKDCIRRYDTDECPMCFLNGGQYYEFTRDDGFCDRGERKEGVG